MREGTICRVGSTSDIIGQYLQDSRSDSVTSLLLREDRNGDGGLRFEEVRFSPAIENSGLITSGSPAIVEVCVRRIHKSTAWGGVEFAVVITNATEVPICTLSTRLGKGNGVVDGDLAVLKFRVPELHLSSGQYNYNVWAGSENHVQDHVTNAGSFTVQERDYFSNGQTIRPSKHGHLLVKHLWEWSVHDSEAGGVNEKGQCHDRR